MEKQKLKWACFQPLIGGMAIGAYKAFGTKPEFMLSYEGYQNNEQHIINYWPDVPYFILDSENNFLKEEDKIKFEELNNIDVMVAVPICSGLSMLNCSNSGETARGSDAKQNENMYNITSYIIEKIKPKAYIFENAPNLYTASGKGVNDKLFKIARDNNYAYSLMKTDTYLHGIPQHRKRTFCFFWNSKNSPILDFIKTPTPLLADYLDEIPKTATHYDEVVFGDLKENWGYKFLVEKYGDKFLSGIDVGFKSFLQFLDIRNLYDEALEFCERNDIKSGIKAIKHTLKKKEMGRGVWDSTIVFPDKKATNAIISKNMTRIMHHNNERFLTVRECMSLMGLPNDFELINPKKNICHITQNVPVNTAQDWINQCIKFCNGELKFSNSVYVKQNNNNNDIEIQNIPKPQTSLESLFQTKEN